MLLSFQPQPPKHMCVPHSAQKGNRKGLLRVALGERPPLHSYQGKGCTDTLSYVVHKQPLCSGLTLKHTMQKRRGNCACICRGFLRVLWLSHWGITITTFKAVRHWLGVEKEVGISFNTDLKGLCKSS